MKALIVTGHFAVGGRRVDLHFIAEQLQRRGYEIDWLTIGLSPISMWKGDGRWQQAMRRPLNRWERLEAGWRSFVWMAALHPFNLRLGLLNRVGAVLFEKYASSLPSAVVNGIGDTALMLIESGLPPVLVPSLKDAAPQARLIYNAADRLETHQVSPFVAEAERKVLHEFQLIRTAAVDIGRDFPAELQPRYIPHGIDKAVFNGHVRSPYRHGIHAVCVGHSLYDAEAMESLVSAFPHVSFHLFGAGVEVAGCPGNVFSYGERPFEELVSYLRYADVGIAPYRPAPRAGYVSQSSLKMIQYTFCRLPIVAPRFAAGGRAHVAPYEPGNVESICRAMASALAFDRTLIDTSVVKDWGEVTDELLARLRERCAVPRD